MEEAPLAQATGHNRIIVVYKDRVVLQSGWQGQNVEDIGHRDISAVNVSGLVNCTLTIENNKGRIYRLDRMARPDASQIKTAIERQKRKAGLYE